MVLDKLHGLRIHGNKAAHGEPVRAQQALWLLKEAHDLGRWLCIQYGEEKADQLPVFTKPPAPGQAEEKERRRILDKLAAQEAQMEALLAELEERVLKQAPPKRRLLSFTSLQARRRLPLTNYNSAKRRPALALSTVC